jgi:hypothetical protein
METQELLGANLALIVDQYSQPYCVCQPSLPEKTFKPPLAWYHHMMQVCWIIVFTFSALGAFGGYNIPDALQQTAYILFMIFVILGKGAFALAIVQIIDCCVRFGTCCGTVVIVVSELIAPPQ